MRRVLAALAAVLGLGACKAFSQSDLDGTCGTPSMAFQNRQLPAAGGTRVSVASGRAELRDGQLRLPDGGVVAHPTDGGRFNPAIAEQELVSTEVLEDVTNYAAYRHNLRLAGGANVAASIVGVVGTTFSGSTFEVSLDPAFAPLTQVRGDADAGTLGFLVGREWIAAPTNGPAQVEAIGHTWCVSVGAPAFNTFFRTASVEARAFRPGLVQP